MYIPNCFPTTNNQQQITLGGILSFASQGGMNVAAKPLKLSQKPQIAAVQSANVINLVQY